MPLRLLSRPSPVMGHGKHLVGRLGDRDVPFQHAGNPFAFGHVQVLQRFLLGFPVSDTARKHRDFRLVAAVWFRCDLIRVIQVHVKVNVFHRCVVPCSMQTNIINIFNSYSIFYLFDCRCPRNNTQIKLQRNDTITLPISASLLYRNKL